MLVGEDLLLSGSFLPPICLSCSKTFENGPMCLESEKIILTFHQEPNY